ncbi:traD, partial [Escherichia coli EC1865]
TSCVVFL